MTRIFLPIFPLPELTFFPRTLLPLHVFEARFRTMVMDCLARDKRMAVVGLKPGYEPAYEGKPAVYPVAGEGRIGIDRELPSDTLYRMVAGSLLGETGAERDGVGALAARVTGRCLGIL